jgi:hypothetical protein
LGFFYLFLISFLQPVLWKYLPSLCEWFVKLFGLVFDAYHSLLSLL